jgi:Rod binding domain-containing protein
MPNDISAYQPAQEIVKLKPLSEKSDKPRVLTRSLADRQRETDEVAELRKASKQFEAVFMFQILKQMRNTVHKEEMFHGGMGEDVFTGMMDEEMSKRMAGRGSAGIAEMMFQQLSRQHGIVDPNAGEGTDKKLPLDVTQSASDLMRRLQGVNATLNAAKSSAISPDF